MSLYGRITAFAITLAFLCSAQIVSPLLAETPAAANAAGGTIVATIVDRGAGTSISGADVTLFSAAGEKVSAGKTDRNGAFTFPIATAGIYYVQISAVGYQTVRTDDIATASGQTSTIRSAIVRASTSSSIDMREIGRVTASRLSGNGSLATATTINQSISSELVQREGYVRIGDALDALPGVNLTGLSSSIGDGLFIDIRGFGSAETSTLVDGHPIGPQGAVSGGYDFQNSPSYAIGNTQVTYGSGALGLYGTSSIGGTVDLQTITPTRKPELLLEQGVGYEGRRFTRIQATGTVANEKLGYAFVHAVDGTTGPYPTQNRLQSAFMSGNFSTANATALTYGTSSGYRLRNDLLKLKYSFTPSTSFEATALSANSFSDKTGNGDNCYFSEGQQLYNYQAASAAPQTYPVALTNGTSVNIDCPAGQLGATLDDTNAVCLSAFQYARRGNGLAGGGAGAHQEHRFNDYHGRIQTKFGNNTITLDGFGSRYSTDYSRAPLSTLNPTPGFNTQFYDTTGLLISDDIQTRTNDLGFGYFVEHQNHTGDYLQQTDTSPSGYRIFNGANSIPGAVFALGERNFFIRDQYTPDGPLSIYLNAWLKRSTVTQKQTFDPRLSFVYRITPSDVVRLTGGRSDAAPAPDLLTGPVTPNRTPSNLTAQCTGGQLTTVGNSSNPNLIQESSTDYEVGYGHRFGGDNVMNVDGYFSFEKNRIFRGTIPVASVPFVLPPDLLAQYFARITQFCGSAAQAHIENLGYLARYNAASTRYQGIELTGRYRANRNLYFDYSYNVQSAADLGVPDFILSKSVNTINNSQIQGVALHKGSLAFDLQNGHGFEARVDGFYQGQYNAYNRIPFFYAHASISQQVTRSTRLNIGVLNLFDSISSKYLTTGVGPYIAENKFGTDANRFQQQTTQTGLTPITAVLSITTRI